MENEDILVNEDGTVTVAGDDYDRMLNDALMYLALEQAGVLDWENYPLAEKIYDGFVEKLKVVLQ